LKIENIRTKTEEDTKDLQIGETRVSQ